MNPDLTRGMAKATELTRSGKLAEATALIQSLLGHGTADVAPPGAGTGDLIEGDFTRLDSASTAPPKPAAKKARPVGTPLAETLRKIRAGGMPARGPLADPLPLPDGAQFLSLTYSGPQGSRDYRLYVPAKRPKGPMPLIVMLHGCTQTPEDFAIGTGMNALAEDNGCLIAYPAQPSGANAQKCWNWFRPEDQGRDRGEPALIAGLTREIQTAYPADPARTYIAGLSAGGAAAVQVAAAYPDIFAAVGVHSGLPGGGARDIPSAFAAMRNGTSSTPHPVVVPTIVFHGSADSTVNPRNGAETMAQALHAMPRLRRTTRQGTAPGGRRYRVTAHTHAEGPTLAEHWEIDGAGHAWAGGHPKGSFTDPKGPAASAQMLRFFLQHSRG
jgi:poly(hydroxyalkanoate) depolymerase family esterase